MKKIVIIAALFAAFTANAVEKKMRLRGEYRSAPDGKVLYLSYGSRNVDSAVVKSGKFEFALTNIEPDEYALTRINTTGRKEVVLVYLDDYDTQIKLEDETYDLFNTHFIKNTTTGSPTQTIISELNDMILRDPVDLSKNTKLITKLKETALRNDMATVYAMWKYAPAYEGMMSIDELRLIVDNLKPEVKNTSVGKRFAQTYKKMFTLIKGGNAPDFTMNTPEGKAVKLSEFLKNKKVVLLDFWASWCAPCRAKNPEILKLYDQYHAKGLDILGVSLDNDGDKWKKAIADDKLPWTQISELKGWKSEICKTYGFSGIPHLVLMNGKGQILAAGPDLRKELETYLQKYL